MAGKHVISRDRVQFVWILSSYRPRPHRIPLVPHTRIIGEMPATALAQDADMLW